MRYDMADANTKSTANLTLSYILIQTQRKKYIQQPKAVLMREAKSIC